MLANQMCNNDCCITCMCIHVITVTSVRPWTQSQDVRGYIWFIPCILVSTRQECEQIEKKSGYTVKRVPLTKNRWRGPFTTAIINWFSACFYFEQMCIYSYHIWRASWYGSYTMTVSQSELQNCIFQMIQFLIKVISIITHSVLLVIQAI